MPAHRKKVSAQAIPSDRFAPGATLGGQGWYHQGMQGPAIVALATTGARPNPTNASAATVTRTDLNTTIPRSKSLLRPHLRLRLPCGGLPANRLICQDET